MHNSTNFTYIPLSFFIYDIYDTKLYQEILSLSMLPTGIIGIFLNILTLLILRSRVFNLSLYVYFRAYTINSLSICFWTGLSFLVNTRSIFDFSNTYNTNWFHIYFTIPILSINYTISSFLDLFMSLERVMLLSNGFQWFKKLKPSIICVVFVLISICLNIPSYFFYKPFMKTTSSNTKETTVYHSISKNFTDLKLYMNVLSYIIDALPIILQIILSISTLALMKSYVKNKSRVTDMNLIRRNTPAHAQTSNDEVRKRARKMEIKLTVLVIILTTLSIL
jgi:hypothetical protein